MANKLPAPIDEAGIPLPILPRSETPPTTDWHHHFHPRRDDALKSSAGKAVRNVRLQRTHYGDHHNEYHGYYYGPPLPQTIDEKFYVVVMCAAGYIPEQALSFEGPDEPKLVDITENQRNQLWYSGDLKISSQSVIRKFLTAYTLNQELDVEKQTIKEFLRAKDEKKRQFLGHLLLAKALENATRPIAPVYRQAWERGLIHPDSPPGPRDLVVNLLGTPRLREQLFTPLRERLVA